MASANNASGSHWRLSNGGLARLSSTLLSAGSLFHNFSSSVNTDLSTTRNVSSAALENVLRNALVKLAASVSSRRHRAIKEQVSDKLELLKKTLDTPADDNVTEPSLQKTYFTARGDALRKCSVMFFVPFEMACASRSTKVILAALDGIQKLLACGFFSGSAYRRCSLTADVTTCNAFSEDSAIVERLASESFIGTSSTKTPMSAAPTPVPCQPNDEKRTNTPDGVTNVETSGRLIDHVVRTVSATSDILDDAVQLQVIRCILTAVTAIQCDAVHKETLASAVRGVFEVYGRSKDVQNQRTAQAALTQIVNTVMRPLETFFRERDENVRTEKEQLQLSSAATPEQSVPSLTDVDPAFCCSAVDVTPDVKEISPELVSESATVIKGHSDLEREQTFVPSTIEPAKLPSHGEEEVDDAGDADTALEMRRTVSLQGDNTVDLEVVTKRRKSYNQSSPSKTTKDTEGDSTPHTAKETVAAGRNPATKHFIKTPCWSDSDVYTVEDALLVFSTLCALSMEDDPLDVSTVHETSVVRVKRLSLELLLSVLHSHSLILKQMPDFIDCIRSELCISLIKNCVSHIPRIFGLSLSIFLVLAVEFKDRMAPEIGVFVDHILLRILESWNSSYEHKHRVLQVFHCLFGDAHVALELYFNFDCDVREKDVFFRTVASLAKIAQGFSTVTEKSGTYVTAEQQTVLQQLALKTLVTLLDALLQWVRKCQDDRVTCATLKRIGSGIATSPLENTSDVPLSNQDFCERRQKDVAESLSASVIVESIPPFVANSSSAGDEPTNSLNSSVLSTIPQTQDTLMTQQRQRKQGLHQGIALFNKIPVEGIAYLIHHGYVENSPSHIASFFLQSSSLLKKKAIGDYLGESDAFNQQVLRSLVELLDFHEMELDTALRKFLSTFRLPGEAQKIDRMMETFASKYVVDNPGSIKPENKMTLEMFIRNNRGINDNADLSAEYLEFLYRRIVAEEWIIEDEAEESDGGHKNVDDPNQGLKLLSAFDPQQQLLEGLAVALGLSAPSTGRRKVELFLKESKGIVTKTMFLIQQKDRDRGAGTHRNSQLNGRVLPIPNSIEHNRGVTADNCSTKFASAPQDGQQRATYIQADAELVGQVQFLFQAIYPSILASFTALLRQEGLLALETADLLLEGLMLSVLLASRFDLVAEAEGFMFLFASFTGLTFSSSGVFAKGTNDALLLVPKRLQGMQKLLDLLLVQDACNVLGRSWKPVLECCSQLNHLLQLHAQRSTEDHSGSLRPSSLENFPWKQTEGVPSVQAIDQDPRSTLDTTEVSVVEDKTTLERAESPQSIVLEGTDLPGITSEYDSISYKNVCLAHDMVDSAQLDLLFTRSTLFSSAGIVAFVTCLCEVSKEELQMPTPRIFSLQKLVEVADYNMNRIRLIWSKIWAVLLQHFIEASMHSRIAIALYAVDSLRQLAVKFLEKDELSNYSFQVEFLKPFLVVMSNEAVAIDVKMFIMEVLQQIVQIRAKNIKSGWKSVFRILATVPLSCQTLNGAEALKLCTQSFEVLLFILREHFWTAAFGYLGDVVRTLVAFAGFRCFEQLQSETIPQSLTVAFQALEFLECLAVVLTGVDYASYCRDVDKAYPNYRTIECASGHSTAVEDEQHSQNNKHLYTRDGTSLASFAGTTSKICSIEPEGAADRYLLLLSKVKRCWCTETVPEQDSLASCAQNIPVKQSDSSNFVKTLVQELQIYLSNYWFPIFTGLTQLVTNAHCAGKIRKSALDTLCRLLRYLGKSYMNHDMWQMTIRGVFFPLFDDLQLHLHREERHQFQSIPLSGTAHPKTDVTERVTPSSVETQSLTGSVKSSDSVTNEVKSSNVYLWEHPTLWAFAASQTALTQLVHLVDEYYVSLAPFLGEVLALIGSCIRGGQVEPVARLGIEALRDVITRLALRWDMAEWNKVMVAIEGYFRNTLPQNLLYQTPDACQDGYYKAVQDSNDVADFMKDTVSDDLSSKPVAKDTDNSVVNLPQSGISLPFHPTKVVRNCVVQLLLINFVREILSPVSTHLSSSLFERLINILLETFRFAREFNRQVAWRYQLKELGFMKTIQQLPRLLKQERESLEGAFEILFKILCVSSSLPECNALLKTASSSLVALFRDVVEDYAQRQYYVHHGFPPTCPPSNLAATTYEELVRIEAERELYILTTLLRDTVLRGFERLHDTIFEDIVADIFIGCVSLIPCSSQLLREAIKQLMLVKVTPLLSKAHPPLQQWKEVILQTTEMNNPVGRSTVINDNFLPPPPPLDKTPVLRQDSR